jgi:hypothetical protein
MEAETGYCLLLNPNAYNSCPPTLGTQYIFTELKKKANRDWPCPLIKLCPHRPQWGVSVWCIWIHCLRRLVVRKIVFGVQQNASLSKIPIRYDMKSHWQSVLLWLSRLIGRWGTLSIRSGVRGTLSSKTPESGCSLLLVQMRYFHTLSLLLLPKV